MAAAISVIVWIDYFRKIDVFESERILHLLIALGIGCGTPYLCLEVYSVFDYFNFHENGEMVNDLIYSILGIGLNEELSKIAGAILAFRILRKHINESIDYMIYAGMVALGFSLVENFMYIERFGIDIVTTRSFYSVLEHIINTSIITYGYFRFKIFGRGKTLINTIVAVLAAISSHGLFDYFIVNPHFAYFSPVLVIIVYLIGINFWISMLNNAINYSSYFDYGKIQYSQRIFYRLTLWYFFTMLIGIAYKTYTDGIANAITHSIYHVISDGFLFLIVIMRVSRFKIYKNYYHPVTVQLPFYFTKNNDEDFRIFNIPIKIRGENMFEYFLTTKLGQSIEVNVMNPQKSQIKRPMLAKVVDKLFLENDSIVYLIHIDGAPATDNYYLKPKTRNKTSVDQVYPINGLLYDHTPLDRPKKLSELKFLEWVFVKSENEVAKVNY